VVIWDEEFARRYDEWSAHMTEDIAFYVDLGRRVEGARRPGRRAVRAGLWLQLLRDLASDVDEALAVLDDVDLVMAEAHGYKATLNVAIEDAGGDSAIIEYVAGFPPRLPRARTHCHDERPPV